MNGTTVWILGFFAFVAGLNAVNATFLWVQLGPETMIQPYLIGSLTGELSTATYLWISVLATFIFLGVTLSGIIGRMPEPAVLKNLDQKVSELQNVQKMLEKTRARITLIDASLSDIRAGVLEGFSEQNADMKKIRADLFTTFDKKLSSFKQDMTKQLGKMQKAVQRAEATNKKNATAVRRQMKEIAAIKLKVEKLEMELTQPKPRLTSQSQLRKVKGIGTHLANELKGIGITSVGELILTDPLIIAEKTDASQKTVEKLQGRAQLMMVPGVKEKDVALLEELGVTTRRKLARQDPIELGKQMNGILKAYVEEGKISKAEKPTIEKLDSWIKSAKP